jgi:hypothetical protein
MEEKDSLPEGSYFADQRSAREAVALALPMIERGIHDRIIGDSGFLYIVIMDPALGPGTCDFQHAILYEHAVGDPADWDADYAQFARDKAEVTWRTGCNGHVARHIAPHLLLRSDTGIWGSACVDGIVVGVSGAQPWYDEAIAGTIAHCLKAVAKARALATPESPWLVAHHSTP